MQLHPGGPGWFWSAGAHATAAAVRMWSRDGRTLAVGLLDGPSLLRLTIAPDARRDEGLARQLVQDVTEPERGVLPEGKASIEAPMDALVQDLLFEEGWNTDEAWTPLRRDLTDPVQDPGVRIEAIGPEQAHVRTAVHRASFDSTAFTDERWPRDGCRIAVRRCPVSRRVRRSGRRGGRGDGVVGRPGVLEPMGVHRDHRGYGHLRAPPEAGKSLVA